MKTSKEIITSIINEELPVIADAKRDIIAIRICKELGLANNIDEDKETGGIAASTIRYNLELSLDDLALVEKYNGTVPGLISVMDIDTEPDEKKEGKEVK